MNHYNFAIYHHSFCHFRYCHIHNILNIFFIVITISICCFHAPQHHCHKILVLLIIFTNTDLALAYDSDPNAGKYSDWKLKKGFAYRKYSEKGRGGVGEVVFRGGGELMKDLGTGCWNWLQQLSVRPSPPGGAAAGHVMDEAIYWNVSFKGRKIRHALKTFLKKVVKIKLKENKMIKQSSGPAHVFASAWKYMVPGCSKVHFRIGKDFNPLWQAPMVSLCRVR